MRFKNYYKIVKIILTKYNMKICKMKFQIINKNINKC